MHFLLKITWTVCVLITLLELIPHSESRRFSPFHCFWSLLTAALSSVVKLSLIGGFDDLQEWSYYSTFFPMTTTDVEFLTCIESVMDPREAAPNAYTDWARKPSTATELGTSTPSKMSIRPWIPYEASLQDYCEIIPWVSWSWLKLLTKCWLRLLLPMLPRW